MSGSDQTRLLLVEDVPQVTQHIRSLLNAQSRVKLLDVLDDGTKALGAIQELRPDVVLVDWLLQGRLKGPRLVEAIREAGLDVPVIVLTVPNNPVEPNPDATDDDPFDSRMSDTTRIVYGTSSWLGIIGASARSARAPCPISRRLGPRMKPASPTENGGKL